MRSPSCIPEAIISWANVWLNGGDDVPKPASGSAAVEDLRHAVAVNRPLAHPEPGKGASWWSLRARMM